LPVEEAKQVLRSLDVVSVLKETLYRAKGGTGCTRAYKHSLDWPEPSMKPSSCSEHAPSISHRAAFVVCKDLERAELDAIKKELGGIRVSILEDKERVEQSLNELDNQRSGPACVEPF
jgi:hypothetical protein